MKVTKDQKGITLITLIIMVIILFILAGVTISAFNGNNILVNAENIAKRHNEGLDAEENEINDVYNQIKSRRNEINGINAELKPMPTAQSVADGTTTFSTEYGTIDVIWLSGTTNTVTSTPNAPVLAGMTPVSWTKSGDTWTEDTTAKTSYYNYSAASGNIDSKSSMWANAKNSDGSYFVWIPRYAYRITYYSGYTEDENGNYIPTGEPTGYYDGYGQWRASDAKVRLALDSGIETVEYEGYKYIVHPAFCNGTQYPNGTSKPNPYDNGEWSDNISGFWVAKYEMSRNGATSSSAGSGYKTTFKSVPNVQSARSITIGNMYNVAKSYNSLKDSHLMKNSEWGAVAYLTHSQYGRNGSEIDINNSSSYITGNGGGSPLATNTSGTTNAYNTTTGAKASTTGNVYGVYDMSGGAWEYVAAFNNTDTFQGYESSYGSSFASTSGSSDKYATKYYNTESTGAGVAYAYGKIGDATKEVNKGGINTSTIGNYNNWFDHYPYLCNASWPFIRRGGNIYDVQYVGVYSSTEGNGGSDSGRTFRVALCTDYPVPITQVLQEGDWVKYDTGVPSVGTNGVISCRVLYNDAEHGLQLISADTVGPNITLGGSAEESKTSYINALRILNEAAEGYLNPIYAVDARCVGSDPSVNSTGIFIEKNNGVAGPVTLSFSFNGSNQIDLPNTDTNYETDFNKILSLGIGKITNVNYWLASRFVRANDGSWINYFAVRANYSGSWSYESLYQVYDTGAQSGYISEKGLRPCFSLKTNLTIASGDGKSEATAYTLGI